MSNSINSSLSKACKTISGVIVNYVEFMESIGNTIEFLDTIGNSIVTCRENVEINKRKLLETKKELF